MGVKLRDVLRYFRELTTARFVLWCYFIWWLSVARAYFDPSPLLWLNSLGISAIIGTGLLLSTAYAGSVRVRIGPWVIARLYMMPFFVSSFAALIKGRGFVLVFFPTWHANLVPLLHCAVLACVWQLARRLVPRQRSCDKLPQKDALFCEDAKMDKAH